MHEAGGNLPGQKAFHVGLTLTQAILVCGGATRDASGIVKISRQGGDGRLITNEYNLNQIQDGKTPDPILERGDRLILSLNR